MTKKQGLFGILIGLVISASLFQVYDFPYFIDMTLLIVFGTFWLFAGGIKAKGLLRDGQLDSFSTYAFAPLIVVFILLDILFNLFVGSIAYREFPREFLFTSRTQRHYYKGSGWRLQVARTWAKRLNAIDPGHV